MGTNLISHRKPRRRRYEDLSGRIFGRLKAIERVDSPAGPVWRCSCECGKESKARASSLTRGKSRSCGCLLSDTAKKTMTTHGMSDSRIYKLWCGMIARCSNPKTKQYADYGGRGIRVCDRWKAFENFLADIGERPSPKHSLDRHPNNDGNYEPTNCRWATRKEQSANRRKMARIDQFSTEELLAELKRRREKVALSCINFGSVSSCEDQSPRTHADGGWFIF